MANRELLVKEVAKLQSTAQVKCHNSINEEVKDNKLLIEG